MEAKFTKDGITRLVHTPAEVIRLRAAGWEELKRGSHVADEPEAEKPKAK